MKGEEAVPHFGAGTGGCQSKDRAGPVFRGVAGKTAAGRPGRARDNGLAAQPVFRNPVKDMADPNQARAVGITGIRIAIRRNPCSFMVPRDSIR
jgi:hypothetical protein